GDSKRVLKNAPQGPESFNDRKSLRPEPTVIFTALSFTGGRGWLARDSGGEEEWSFAAIEVVSPNPFPLMCFAFNFSRLVLTFSGSHSKLLADGAGHRLEIVD